MPLPKDIRGMTPAKAHSGLSYLAAQTKSNVNNAPATKQNIAKGKVRKGARVQQSNDLLYSHRTAICLRYFFLSASFIEISIQQKAGKDKFLTKK